ncbi:MAG: gliding motility protein GldN [Muribaculaceae bacterium]|nr:gliding motility protein GldN [Muribaculaceae bacterium]
MHKILRHTVLALAVACMAVSASAQDENSGVVRRRSSDRNAQKQQDGTVVTERMQNFFSEDNSSVSDADRQWMRVIYRSIDLDKDKNAALYFPEEPVDGQENLFRIIMRLLAQGTVPAYEYLDGREIFTDKYRIKTRDVLDRFYIPYTEAKGSTEKNPKFAIDENDVPTNEVLSYYIVERWEFDTRSNRLRPVVEAICPVLHRTGDFGGDALKYPMFWVKFSDLRPYLAAQTIFVDDDNNLPTCTYDDFFTLSMYDGDIYKTRNLKNKSMVQLYPDPDNLKRAQDSIQNRLDTFEKKLWVPSREEVIAAREAREALAAGAPADSTAVEAAIEKTSPTRANARSTKRSTKRSDAPKPKKAKVSKPKSSSSSSSNAVRSVRRRK